MSENDPSKEANAFENPTGMAARLRNPRSRDAGAVSVGRRDKRHFKDPNVASAMSALTGSTSITLKAEQQTRDEVPSAERSHMHNASKKSSLRNFADVAGLGLHDAPPRGRPVKIQLPAAPKGILKKGDSGISKKGDSYSEVDQDLVSAIEKLVATRQGDASASSASSTSSDLTSLTQQIQKLAESRRAALAQPSSATAQLPPKKEETPHPADPPASTISNQLNLKNNEAESRRAALAQPSSATAQLPPKEEETPHPVKPPASTGSNQMNLKNNEAESRRAALAATAQLPPKKEETPHSVKRPPSPGSNQMDLKNNDNAFIVIAGLILESFNQVKEGAPLTASALAQLDRSVPTHIRQGFVEAVQYRFENSCPPGSTELIHVVTRKCQELGLARNDGTNPLLTKTTTVDVSNVSSASSLVKVLNEKKKGTTAVQSRTESLAHQQLVAELQEASNFMAESKTKEAANFWRSHVAELQARLRTLHGESTTGNKDTEEDLREANRRFLGDSDPLSRSMARYTTDQTIAIRDPSSRSMARYTNDQIIAVRAPVGFSESFASENTSGIETDSDSSGLPRDEGILVKAAVFGTQLIHLEKIYELIDLLIELLSLDKLMDLLEPQKLSDLVTLDKLKTLLRPESVRAYLEEKGYGKYTDFNNLKRYLDPAEYDEVMADLKNPETLLRLLTPEQFNELFTPEKIRESMNFDKIRDLLSSPENLSAYFEKQELAKMWDLDKLRDLMDTNRLRAALDSDNIRQVLAVQPTTFRSFMGDTYRGFTSTVDVVAPATLPGGYKFEAEVDGHRFVATVPQGGVKKGETFTCEMRDLDSLYLEEIPFGGWRDRLCDCYAHGSCHPVIWTTVFCPLLALGQIMTRLRLDICGRRQTKDKTPFAVMSAIVIMWGMMNLAIFAAFNYKWSQRIELSGADYCALGLINLSVLVFAMYATASTRATLREKFLIREHRCFDLEDCCCGTFCMPCTICQMSRHTVDFKLYEAACCTETGLEEGSDIPNTGSDLSGTNYFCADNKLCSDRTLL